MDYWGLISQAKAWLISFGTPPSLGLILIMFAILRWAARYVAVIALLDFPGTLCHELISASKHKFTTNASCVKMDTILR